MVKSFGYSADLHNYPELKKFKSLADKKNA